MWIMLNDAFLSIVYKDCERGELLVRARREGDIQRIFPRANVTRSTGTDYLFRAVLPQAMVEAAIVNELRRVTYPNFKDTVTDKPLHDAYLGVWHRMSQLQNPPPFSGQPRLWRRHAREESPLSIEEEAHLFATGHMPPDAGIDTSDIPEAGEDFFRKAKVRKLPGRKAKKRSLRKGR